MSGFQRADGAFGSFIVRQSRSKDPQSPLYDYDLPEHVILVSDWLGELALAKFLAHAHDGKDDIPSSIIVNGKGRISKPRDKLTSQEFMPLAVFKVEQVSFTLGTHKLRKCNRINFLFAIGYALSIPNYQQWNIGLPNHDVN